MLFTNKGERIIKRIGNSDNCRWVWIKPGQEVDLPEKEGLELGLTPIKALEGKIGGHKVETKIEDKKESLEAVKGNSDDFYRELEAIKGIGPKTAKEISSMYSLEELKDAIKNNLEFLKQRFRDNIVKKLEEKYGK